MRLSRKQKVISVILKRIYLFTVQCVVCNTDKRQNLFYRPSNASWKDENGFKKNDRKLYVLV